MCVALYLGIVGDGEHTQGVSSGCLWGRWQGGESEDPYPPLMDRETLGESLLLDGLHPAAKKGQAELSVWLETRLRGSWGINSKNSRALRDGLLFHSGNPGKREVSLLMSLLLELGPAVSGPDHWADLHPRSIQGAQLQLSHRWHNKLWATSGAAETWGPRTLRLTLNNAKFSPSFSPFPPGTLCSSMSLCHISYHRLKLCDSIQSAESLLLRILGIHCLAAFSGPLHGYIV